MINIQNVFEESIIYFLKILISSRTSARQIWSIIIFKVALTVRNFESHGQEYATS